MDLALETGAARNEEPNRESVRDIEGEFIDCSRLSRQLPGGFDLTQPLIEVFGLGRRCRAKTQAKHSVANENLIPRFLKHRS